MYKKNKSSRENKIIKDSKISLEYIYMPSYAIISWNWLIAFQTPVHVSKSSSDPCRKIQFPMPNLFLVVSCFELISKIVEVPVRGLFLLLLPPKGVSLFAFLSRCVPRATGRVPPSAVTWRRARGRITITAPWKTKPRSKRIPHRGSTCKSRCLLLLHKSMVNAHKKT